MEGIRKKGAGKGSGEGGGATWNVEETEEDKGKRELGALEAQPSSWRTLCLVEESRKGIKVKNSFQAPMEDLVVLKSQIEKRRLRKLTLVSLEADPALLISVHVALCLIRTGQSSPSDEQGERRAQQSGSQRQATLQWRRWEGSQGGRRAKGRFPELQDLYGRY